MRLKDLFTVPTGQKVTEKHLRRVLISSICSILLCMSCLVGSTWAWFAVSLENTGNVIEIGTPEVNLTVKDEPFTSGTTLQPETYKVSMEHANESDDFNKKSILYVTLTIGMIDENTTVYTTLNHENEYKQEFTIVASEEFSLSWNVSWFAPANATELIDDIITLNPIVNNTVTSDAAGTDESTQTEQDEVSEPSEDSEYSEPSEEDSEEDSNDSSESGEVKTESTEDKEITPTEELTPDVESTDEPTEESSEDVATKPTEEIQATEATEESSATEEEEESTSSLEASESSETSESITAE